MLARKGANAYEVKRNDDQNKIFKFSRKKKEKKKKKRHKRKEKEKRS